MCCDIPCQAKQILWQLLSKNKITYLRSRFKRLDSSLRRARSNDFRLELKSQYNSLVILNSGFYHLITRLFRPVPRYSWFLEIVYSIKSLYADIFTINILQKLIKNNFKYTNYVKTNTLFIYCYLMAQIFNFTVSKGKLMRFKPNAVFVITVFRNPG